MHEKIFSVDSGPKNPNSSEELERLRALSNLSILDTLPEQSYDDVTELASFICGTPISLVSLVAAERQWFKSTKGLPVSETPRSQSFCAHTIPTGRTLIVEDALLDPRFCTNPLVLGDPKIRFYAGAPVFAPGGEILGTVCVIDRQPRVLSATQVAALDALARQVTALLAQRQMVQERRSAERIRENLTTQLEQILAAVTDGVAMLDRSWNFAFLNERGRQILQAKGDLLGKNAWEEFPAMIFENSPYVYYYHRAMNEGIAGDFVAEYPDPLNIGVQIFARPVSNGIIVIFRDITDQKRSERALIQNEKLAAVGRLASSIAHEINNPLEAVTNLLYLARKTNEMREIRGYLASADTAPASSKRDHHADLALP